MVRETTEAAQIQAFSERYVIARRSIRFWLGLEASRIVAIRQRFRPLRGRLLEIGCSTGELLLKFRERGYQVEGVELARAAASFARSRYKLDVQSVALADFDAEGIYDTVVAIHTLEHFSDQTVAIDKILKLLRPGGLALIEVPSIESWNVRLKGNRADVFTDEHLVFHSRRSLEFAFRKAGFEIERVWTAESLTGLFNTLMGALGVISVGAAFVRRLRGKMTVNILESSPVLPLGASEVAEVEGSAYVTYTRTPPLHNFLAVARFSLTGLAILFGFVVSPWRWALSRSGLGGAVYIVARRPCVGHLR